MYFVFAIEPFAALFWALGIVLVQCAYTETVDPACQPSIPQQWYWHGTVPQGSVWFNLRVKMSATCFSYLAIYYLSMLCLHPGNVFITNIQILLL